MSHNNRVPNHRIDSLVSKFEPFSNYNHTIHAWLSSNPTSASPLGGTYTVQHHRTVIAVIDYDTDEILDLAYWGISQTTSTLVGRILRSLPQDSVRKYLSTARIPAHDAKRLARMARIA